MLQPKVVKSAEEKELQEKDDDKSLNHGTNRMVCTDQVPAYLAYDW
jgi:hypothetical protein